MEMGPGLPPPAHLSPALQAAWPSGTECIAKYNFHGTAEQDLPFCKGDVLTIVAVTKVIGDLTRPHLCPPASGHSSWVGAPLQGGQRRAERVSGMPSPQDPNWYKAKNKVGREGIIPANYVQKREGVKAGTKLSLMP